MTSILHRAFGPASFVFSSLRARPLGCRHLSQNLLWSQNTPRIPQSLILRKSLLQPRRQFFSSTPITQRLSRPYPHRPHNQNPRRPFLGFLDAIPENTLFWSIITINGVVFVMWYMSSQRLKQERDPSSYKWMLNNFTNSWRNISSGRVWGLVTSCFSHENFGHILFNGFTFFFMARPVLSMVGPRQFLFLYMGGGIIANICSTAWTNLVKGRDNGSYGASGAIYSVVSFLACVAPRMTFQLYGIIPIPAWLAVAGIFTYDTYSAVNNKQPGTDTAGHVAGLLAGAGFFLARRFRLF